MFVDRFIVRVVFAEGRKPLLFKLIKRRQNESWDTLQVGTDPDYDPTVPRAIVNEYDSLLIEIGAIKPEEAKSA